MITTLELTEQELQERKIEAQEKRLQKRIAIQKIKLQFDTLTSDEKESKVDDAINLYLERYCKHVHTKSTKRELKTSKLVDHRCETTFCENDGYIDVDLTFANFNFRAFKRQDKTTMYALDDTYTFTHAIRIEFQTTLQAVNELKAVIAKVTEYKNKGITFHRFANILTGTLRNR